MRAALLALCLAASCAGTGGSDQRGRPTSTGVTLIAGRHLPSQGAQDEDLLDRLAAPDAVGRVHVILELRHGLQPAAFKALDASGVRLVHYLGRDFHAASVALPFDPRDGALAEAIEWVGVYERGDKLHPAFRQGPLDRWYLNEVGEARVLVVFFADVPRARAEELLEADGWTARTPQGVGRAWLVEGDPARLELLCRHDEVNLVRPAPPPPRPSAVGPLEVTGSDAVQSADVSGIGSAAQIEFSDGRSGEGVRIAICDDGMDVEHPDFALLGGDVACSPVQSARLFADVFADHGVDERSEHGTHVASIAGGNGSASWNHTEDGIPAGDFALRGHAPRACLGNFWSTGSTLSEHHAAIVEHGSHVLNHSYGLGISPSYGEYERDLDSIVRGDESHEGEWVPPRPQVWAAGNHGVCDKYQDDKFTGYFSVRNSSKNAIVVGSVDLFDAPPALSQFSSLGPTFDQRLKPDLVAPGALDSKKAPQDCSQELTGSKGILAATVRSGTTAYQRMAGTSMAAPVVSGVLALVMEEIRETLGILPESVRPSTYRALLIHTADGLTQSTPIAGREVISPDTSQAVVYPDGPDHATGWGLVQADRAVERAGDAQAWVEDVFAASGQVHESCLQVEPGAAELRVTLAWDDAPGPADVEDPEPRIVNDLDLILVAPDGEAHFPASVAALHTDDDSFVGGPDPESIADQIALVEPAQDHTNNVEVVTIPTPSSGVWGVRVTAHDLPIGETQHYSLVASHALNAPCFEGPTSVPPDDRPEKPEPQLDICEFMPSLCTREVLLAARPILVESGVWEWGSDSVLPIEGLRAHASLPPRAEVPAWELAPGYTLLLEGAPPRALAYVFDDGREVRARSSVQRGTLRVDLPPRPLGERHYLVLAGIGRKPVQLTLRLVEAR